MRLPASGTVRRFAAPAGDGLFLPRMEAGEPVAFHELMRAYHYLNAKSAAGECV